MISSHKHIFLILFLLVNLICRSAVSDNKIRPTTSAQTVPILEPNTFNKEEWQELKKKIKIKDYKAEKKADTVKKAGNKKKDKNRELFIPEKWRLIIKWSLFILLLTGLLFLVLNVLGVSPFTKKNDKNKIQVGLEEIEENLDTAVLDPHLYKAIKEKNYKLAIRLYYLMIIQKLALKNKIYWKKHKTNRQYLKELTNQEEFPVMYKLTLSYEKSWFGEKELTEGEYNNVNTDFVNFLQNII